MKFRTLAASILVSAMIAVGSTAATASDELAGAIIGGGAGAIVGHAVGGTNGAAVGGFLGAMLGIAVADDDHRHHRAVAYPPRHHAVAPVLVRHHYAPPPVRHPHYAPPPAWYGPRHIDHHGWNDRDGRGDRGWDRDHDRKQWREERRDHDRKEWRSDRRDNGRSSWDQGRDRDRGADAPRNNRRG